MFDIGWSEMAIIMLLALIIIGPKDLPRVARTVGQWVRKGRMLAREFQTSLEDMARETELDDVKKEIEKVGKTDFKKSVENAIDPKGELTKAFDTTTTPKAETQPSLTDQSKSDPDQSGAAKEKTSTAATANGHANGSAGSPSTSPAKAGDEAKTGAKKTSSAKTTTTKAPAKAPSSKAKSPARTGQRPAKTAAKKTTPAKKPASSAKASAKPSTSAKSPSTKRAAAKPASSRRAASDDGDGADQPAVAAKPS